MARVPESDRTGGGADRRSANQGAQTLERRLDRRLVLITLGVALLASTLMSLLAVLLVGRLSGRDAVRSTTALQRQLSVALTSSLPLHELRRQVQLTTSAGEADLALVLDSSSRVLAASDSAMVGESLPEVLRRPEAQPLRRLLEPCLRPGAPADCLGQPLLQFVGPIPGVGGSHVVAMRTFPLALESSRSFDPKATVLTVKDLEDYRTAAIQLTLTLIFAGLVPLLLSSAALLWLVRRRVLPELIAEAHTDELSGVYNRRAFREKATERLDRALPQRQEMVLALLDIDHFKAINDGFGHAAGDEVIRYVSEFLLTALRRTDLVGRLGGDEFSLLLAIDRSRAHALLERTRQALEAAPLRIAHDQVVHIRLSVGLASTSGIASWQLQPLLEAADAALYVAKDRGRNQVVDLEDMSRDPEWQVRVV
jgi:diguanylate cyclase (GGDEF)-like protein